MIMFCAFNVKAQHSLSPQNSMQSGNSQSAFSQASISNMVSTNATNAEMVLSQTSGAIADGGVACGDSGAGTTGDNYYMRNYYLADYGVTGSVQLKGIEFFVSTSSGSTGLQVMVFNVAGGATSLDVTNLPAPLASGFVTVDAGMVGTMVRANFSAPANASANTNIVAVVFESDGQTSQFYLGTAADETTPSYLASVACGINNPVPVATIGFPDAKHVINLIVDSGSNPLAISCVPNASRMGACQYTVIGSEFDATFTGTGTLTNNLNGTATLAGQVLLVGVTQVIWTVTGSNGQTVSCTTTITVGNSEILSQTSGAISDGGVACGDSGAGTTGDNYYMRNYNLADYGLTGSVQLTGLEFFVSTASGASNLQVMVFNVAGGASTLDVTNLPSPLASGFVTVSGSMVGTMVRSNFTNPVVASANTNIVAVVFESDGQTSQFYLGTAANETAPSYLASVACGLNNPVPVETIGFPDAKHIINLVIAGESDPLTINCVPNATRNTNVGVPYYTVVGNEFDATFANNCAPTTLINNRNGSSTLANEVLPIGNTTIIWTVSDGRGQSATCTTVITVVENNPITISCAPNGTRDTNPGVCQYTIIGSEFDASFTGSGVLTNNLNGTSTLAGRVVPKGVSSVVWTVTAGNGQSVSCTMTITVEDNETPQITCVPAAMRETNAGVSYYTVVGNEFDATFTDNCSNSIISNNRNGTATLANENLPVGNTTIIWTVNDGNGQIATCTTVVTVESSMPLTIGCAPNGTRSTDPGVCQYTVIGNEFDATFTGNGVLTNSINGTATLAGRVIPKGLTSVVWTVVGGNGQTVSCSMTINVEDNEAPILSCPSDLMVEIEVGNQYYVLPDYFATGEATVYDNCTTPLVNLSQNPAPGSQLPEGVHTITLSAIDEGGNIASCSFSITVDNTVGIDSMDYGTISLYPVPVKNVLNVSNPRTLALKTFSIFDMTGRLIKTLDLNGAIPIISLDVSMLSQATYMVVLSGENGQVSKLIIKE